jgi:hypothetical protein
MDVQVDSEPTNGVENSTNSLQNLPDLTKFISLFPSF